MLLLLLLLCVFTGIKMSTSWVSSMLGFKQLTASIGADPYQKPDVFYACATVRLLQCCGDQTFEINKKINACNFNQENYVGGRSLAKCKSRQIMQKTVQNKGSAFSRTYWQCNALWMYVGIYKTQDQLITTFIQLLYKKGKKIMVMLELMKLKWSIVPWNNIAEHLKLWF